MKLCFHVFQVHSVDAKFPYGISFLHEFGFELHFEQSMDETVVSETLRTGHCSRVKNIFQIALSHKNVVKKTPMFVSRMHPGSFLEIFLLEDCAHNGKLTVSAELELETPIVITVTNVVPIKDYLADHLVPPNSSIEVAKY